MICLLKIGGGASTFSVEDFVLAPAEWASMRASAAKLLRSRRCERAAELFESKPWELRKGTNDFNDDFSVLYHEVTMEEYVEIEATQPQLMTPLRQIAEALSDLRQPVRFIAVDFQHEASPAPVVVPQAIQSSDVVETALSDAEAAITSGRPQAGVDRAHTALHGYLKALCVGRGVAASSQCDSIQACLTHLRTNDSRFISATQDAAVLRIIRSLTSVADSLNGIRNNASLAHPAEGLLEPAEAMLAINAMRTILRYVHDKTSP